MTESRLLEQLEALAEKLGIRVRYENLRKTAPGLTGGFCRIRGEYHLMMDKRTGRQERVGFFLEALRRFELSGIYMTPRLRALLEGLGDRGREGAVSAVGDDSGEPRFEGDETVSRAPRGDGEL